MFTAFTAATLLAIFILWKTCVVVPMREAYVKERIGKLSLDDTFSERDQINDNIVREIDKASVPWGIKVMRYEIRNIDPSVHVVETLEKQMEAERQKRARILL